ncbi:MAG: hypothetical protein ACKOVH_00560 [Actinomycetota bacterium]
MDIHSPRSDGVGASRWRHRPGRGPGRAVATALAAALALVACGPGISDGARSARPGRPGTAANPTGPGAPATTPTTASTPGAPVGTAPTPAATEVAEAFRFSAPALGGGRVDGRDFAATGAALWFWAPG